MSDALDRHKRAIAEFDRVVAAADGKWDAPSPCAEWTAKDVADHVIGNHRMIAERFGKSAPAATGAPSADWADARDAALQTLEGADLSQTVQGPMGEVPAEVFIGIMSNDTVIHAWDLARAVGADDELPDDLARSAYDMMSPFDDMLRASGMFGPRIDVGEDATATQRLVAFSGRQP